MSLPVGVRGRRSIRMRGFDHAEGGVFFVTVCTAGRSCLFGEVADCEMRPNAIGRLVADCWMAIADHRSDVAVDAFVVMPNHIHGLLRLASVGATLVSPCSDPRSKARGPAARSIGAIVGCFKADVTRRAQALGDVVDGVIWQRNYHEHLVRDDRSLERIRQYIAANPAQWSADHENPCRAEARPRTRAGTDPWCV